MTRSWLLLAQTICLLIACDDSHMAQSPKTQGAKTQSAKTHSAKTQSAKTLSAKPQFGHRHHRPAPRSGLDDSPASVWRRFDWPLVALVAVVFLAGFVWLFPG